MVEVLIKAMELSKTYGQNGISFTALHNINIEIHKGEFSAIAGPSGSGKTTLLNILGGLDTPTSGKVYLYGKEYASLKKGELADFRRDHIGFVFQSYNLIPVLTAFENIEYVMMLQGISPQKRRERIKSLLKELGIESLEKRFPGELSGGEQQRVAIARALVTMPDIIFADEPTANLDSKNATSLLDMMANLNKKHGATIVFSTHDPMVMARAKRLITIHDGFILSGDRHE